MIFRHQSADGNERRSFPSSNSSSSHSTSPNGKNASTAPPTYSGIHRVGAKFGAKMVNGFLKFCVGVFYELILYFQEHRISSRGQAMKLSSSIVREARNQMKGLDPENMYIECPLCHKRIKRLYHFQRHMR